MGRRTASTRGGLPNSAKLRDWVELAQIYARGRRQPASTAGIEGEAAYVAGALERHGHGGLHGSRVLEIGYGARPWLLAWLIGNGVDAFGVDLDRPLLRLSPRAVARVARTNGGERALKSVGRLLIEGGRERTALERRLVEVTGSKPRFSDDQLLVADAASPSFWNGIAAASLHVVFSLDVLEHVPEADLPAMLSGIARSLKPDGIAVLRPNVYTGITGGHLHEWYPDQVMASVPKSTEPWEHLRSTRVMANTYLNGLSRRAYRRLFEQQFDVLEDAAVDPALGRELLTGSIRDELAQWDDYELFSNQVTFVLRPR